MANPDLSTIPEECSRCDVLCEDVDQCIGNYCTVANAVIATAFLIVAILLAIRLVQFYLYKKRPLFSLKKLLYIFGLGFCLLRSFRYYLVLGKFQHLGFGANLFDRLLYWVTYEVLWAMYSMLVLFWATICDSSSTAQLNMGSWLTAKTKILLVVTNTILVVFLIASAIVQLTVGFEAVLITNLVFVLAMLALSISYLVQGTKLLKLLSKFSHGQSPQNRRTVLAERVTRMTIGASSMLNATILVTIVGTIIRAAIHNHTLCQTSHLVFRFCELVAVGVIAIPLRKFRDDIRNTDSSIKVESSIYSTTPESKTELSRIPSEAPILE